MVQWPSDHYGVKSQSPITGLDHEGPEPAAVWAIEAALGATWSTAERLATARSPQYSPVG